MAKNTRRPPKRRKSKKPKKRRARRHVADLRGRSNADLLQWGVQLLTSWGLEREVGLHMIGWAHDEGCPLHPDGGRSPWGRCQCQPDGTLILHLGTPHECRVHVVRDGIPLPVRDLREGGR